MLSKPAGWSPCLLLGTSRALRGLARDGLVGMDGHCPTVWGKRRGSEDGDLPGHRAGQSWEVIRGSAPGWPHLRTICVTACR